MVTASPSANKGNWTNLWQKVFTDAKTPSLFQGGSDTKLAGESSGDLPLYVCAHLHFKYPPPYPFVTEFHLLKQNTLFPLHSKQAWHAELKG